MAKEKRELLCDYVELFDVLQLDLLPGEDIDDCWEIRGLAVIEYYTWLWRKTPHYVFNDDDNTILEVKEGCDALRQLLKDMGEADFTDADPVWKTLSERSNHTMLLLGLPIMKSMWS
jgi:hypothetical protein